MNNFIAMFDQSLGQRGVPSLVIQLCSTLGNSFMDSLASWVDMTQLFRKFDGGKLMTIKRNKITWKCYSRVLCRFNELPQGNLSTVGPGTNTKWTVVETR